MKNWSLRLLLAAVIPLALVGCKNFIVPELGAVARPEARIAFTEGTSQYSTKDLTLAYALSFRENVVVYMGELRFDRSLTDSFPVMKTFRLRLSYLDADGRVLESFDVTPLIPMRGSILNSFRNTQELPVIPGTKSFAFNYFGVFQDSTYDTKVDWQVFEFPFD
jgi:hypothetical protein